MTKHVSTAIGKIIENNPELDKYFSVSYVNYSPFSDKNLDVRGLRCIEKSTLLSNLLLASKKHQKATANHHPVLHNLIMEELKLLRDVAPFFKELQGVEILREEWLQYLGMVAIYYREDGADILSKCLKMHKHLKTTAYINTYLTSAIVQRASLFIDRDTLVSIHSTEGVQFNIGYVSDGTGGLFVKQLPLRCTV